jgi:hypothetical protein
MQYVTVLPLHCLCLEERKKTLRCSCLDDWFEDRCLNSGLPLYESLNHHFVTFVMHIINVSEHENPELSILSCIWEVVTLNGGEHQFS